ncbi:hypothetical protein Dsin_015689 [Dipteronia sinensis]|uniref:RNase H type-1 domain-containing protein n=1 Tax=Dipteronia sinensis TaxID=43782 RepID=A0AAE0E680_9ROSI|nr:hypothetical protein Dsin_015689 [Dipteronia sinensis]
MGGKYVLIKAVAQAMPIFKMSMFKIPLGLCKELEALCSGFWWGTKDGKRKIRWVSWKKACAPKINGGLGFKDLAVFNQALLAKQVRRLAVRSESLAFRLLKAKYFRKDEFLRASLKPGATHVWSIIIWRRELLVKEIRWKGRLSMFKGLGCYEILSGLAKCLKMRSWRLYACCVELDTCNVVSKVSSILLDVGETEFVVNDIKALFKEVEVQKCQTIPRNGNRVAHNLASLALASKEVFVWHAVCLSVIVPFLLL